MFRKFIGEKYFCGLDLGPQTLKAAVLEPGRNHSFELHGVYEVKAAGIEGGTVADLNALAATVHEVLAGLARNTRIRIKSVQAGIGGDMVRRRVSGAVAPLVDRGSRVITPKDIRKVQEQARLLGVRMDEVILQDFPQTCIVDDVNRTFNPAGLYGRKLETEILLAVINSTVQKNLLKAVNQAGFDVENVFFTTGAAAGIALDPLQQQQGCVFMDIGSAVTDIAVFLSGRLRSLDSLPVGGDDMTRAVAAALDIHPDMADDIKKSYASVRHHQAGEDEEILIRTGEGYLPVKRSRISDALEPVVSDLVNMARASLKREAAAGQPAPSVLVMSGGGSLLSGLGERVEEEMGLPVKMAQISFLSRRMHNAAKFLSAVGIAAAGFQANFGLLTKHSRSSHWIKAWMQGARDVYEEYF